MRAGKNLFFFALGPLVCALVCALGGGCQKAPPPEIARPATAARAPAAPARPAKAGPIPWIEDDLPGALARARDEHKPLFIDGWAPWCHTCLSMRSYVFTDLALAPLAGRFVWLAIDTEKAGAAAFLARYPMDAWPTFFIVDPEGGQVAGRWLGSFSIAQLRGFLDDGERTVQLAHAGRMKPDDPLALMRAGDQAALDGRLPEAASRYAEARAKAPAGWPRRTEALVGQIGALMKGRQAGPCVELGLAELDRLGDGPNAADFVSMAVDCTDALAKDDPRVERLRRAAVDRLLTLCADARAPLTADDRGDAWRMIWELRETLGDPDGAHEAARKRLAVLDEAAAKAPDAEAAGTFDWARAESLLYLGRGDDAAALLAKSEAALPDDYNPPARLARVRFAQKQYGEALAAIDRALAKAYGPRKGTLLGLKADILERQGRRAEARKVVEETIALYEGLPQKRPEALASARKRLATLEE